jgi:hypothetical protein
MDLSVERVNEGPSNYSLATSQNHQFTSRQL